MWEGRQAAGLKTDVLAGLMLERVHGNHDGRRRRRTIYPQCFLF